MKLDLRPMIITCPDCPYQTNSWALLTVHWRKAWRSPRRFGKHYKPRATANPGANDSTKGENEMSLYNMLFGRNPSAPILLAMLGTHEGEVPRFRDCYLKDGYIVIHTRTGGGNRDEYQDQNEYLHTLAGFVSDQDGDFDCTYADFTYTIPEKFKAECEILAQMGGERDPGAAWQDLFAKLTDPAKKDDLQVLATLDKMKPIMDKLEAALKGDGDPIITV